MTNAKLQDATMHANATVRLALIDEPRLAPLVGFDSEPTHQPEPLKLAAVQLAPLRLAAVRLAPLRLAPVGQPDTLRRGADPAVAGRELAAPHRTAILLARRYLLSEQKADGSWSDEQPADAGLLARLLLWEHYRETPRATRCEALAAELRCRELPSGAWGETPDGAADLSTSVLSYLALKLCDGVDALAELVDARQVIHTLGGLAAANGETLAWLALFGQHGTGELSTCDGPIAQALATAEPRRISPLRGVSELLLAGAQRCAEALEHPTNSLSPVAALLWRRLAMSSGEDGDQLDAEIDAILDTQTMQSSTSDSLTQTARAVAALIASGAQAEQPPLVAAMDWLLAAVSREAPTPAAAPSVLLALAEAQRARQTTHDELPPDLRLDHALESEPSAMESSAMECSAMECSPGRQQQILAAGDRLARRLAGDSSAAALQSVALWSQAASLQAGGQKEVESGRQQLVGEQAADGSWQPADGAPLPATTHALAALMAAGGDADGHAVLAAVNWLLAQQDAEGNWGDVQQSALAISALAAAGFATQRSVDRAVEALLDQQAETGAWDDSLQATSAALRALSHWMVVKPTRTTVGREACLRLVTADGE